MELLEGGTLKNLINMVKEKKISLTDYDCSIILKKISEGIKYIHDKDIVHRDIKPGHLISKYNICKTK